MQHIFPVFLRLFFAFLAAKLLARFFGLESLGSLISLTLLFLANVYLFDYLDYRSRTSCRRRRESRQPETSPSLPPPPPKQTPET